MHNFQIQAALVFTLGTVSAVASSADMLTAFMLSSLLSKPDVSIQVLSSAAEGNTTVDDFVTEAQVISSGNKEDNQAALNTQPDYCPDSYETMPMCTDCGGFTLLYFKELDYYDTRCKGVGDDEYLKDCSCLERRYQEDDDIVCDIFASDPDPDPEATRRKTEEAMAQVPDTIIDPLTGTEFTSVDQPHIVLDDDFWTATVQDNTGQSDDKQEDECLPKESI
ncbi:hypothetical protein KCU95_g9772, partial [Aureobasidium melanogenum]